jgi:hypothetical protein
MNSYKYSSFLFFLISSIDNNNFLSLFKFLDGYNLKLSSISILFFENKPFPIGGTSPISFDNWSPESLLLDSSISILLFKLVSHI